MISFVVQRIRFFFQEIRRQAAAHAADQRAHQSDNRGVNEDELRRMKQRQIDRDHLEDQQRKHPNPTGNNNTGLRVSSSILLPPLSIVHFHLVANELILFLSIHEFLLLNKNKSHCFFF